MPFMVYQRRCPSLMARLARKTGKKARWFLDLLDRDIGKSPISAVTPQQRAGEAAYRAWTVRKMH